MKRQLVLIVAILAAWLGAVATATAAASVPTNLDVIYAHTYGGDHHSSPETDGTTQRGLRTHSQTLTTAYAYDAVDRSWYGRSARPESDHADAAATYTTVDTALYWAGSITTTREQAARSDGDLSPLALGRVAANSGSRIAANQAAGNAARDALSAAHPGSLIEQSFSTTAGVRRLDVLTQGGLGIESKVGRTSLTAATRSQVAKDSLLLRNGDVTGMEWVFSRGGVTGQIGPTGPLADALGKAGIPWSLAP